MAFTDFSNLKAQIAEWMARTDVLGSAEDFISLGEARFNRELKPVEINETLTGTNGSREIDISSLSCVAPIALFLAEPGLDEVELTPKADGTFVYAAQAGRPRFWAVSESKIIFDRELNGDYPFRFRFRQKFALSEDAPTNWLLTEHPDIYLAGVLVWGGLFIRDNTYAAQFQGVLNAGLAEVKSIIAQSKRSVSTVDPALQRIGKQMRGTYNGTTYE